MKTALISIASALALTACTYVSPISQTDRATLRIASWNMEHLAEANGSGCRPRTDADYAAMREYANKLNADVIAFQEVESVGAAYRVFNPALYTVVIEHRVSSGREGSCRGLQGQTIRAQRTGFAVKKDVRFARLPDYTELQLGDPDLRSGVDLVVRPKGGRPLRVLSVHLKSGCSSGDRDEPCAVFLQQVPVMERWIDARARERVRFAVLGDFNRRLAMSGDAVWTEWDDASPANADLTIASGEQSARCNPRYRDFIDFIVLDHRSTAGLTGFDEHTFEQAALSDHCAISATLAD